MLENTEKTENHTLTAIKQSASSICLCTFDGATAFYLRTEYLEVAKPSLFEVNSVFSTEEFDDCVQAGLCYSIERQAFVYLNASEHSRFLLKNKLAKKDFDICLIEKVLDFLQAENFLNDKRYAEAFVKNRAITHNEGKTRLLKELLVRGVCSNDAKEALENYYELYSEEEFCKKAIAKLKRLGKKNEKLVTALQRAGFSLKMINQFVN